MKYPQGYIFLEEKTQLPVLSTLQAWFGAGTEIYMRNPQKPSKILNDRIALLEELHRYAMKKSDYQMRCIVFCGTCVSSTLLLANGTNVIKVYWIDSAKQAQEIKEVSEIIRTSVLFSNHVHRDQQTYQAMSEYIRKKTNAELVGDDEIQRFFIGRNWWTTSEAEIHIRQIAKNETRAGVLRRIDLEDSKSATSM